MNNNLPTTSINELGLQKQSWFSRFQNLRILIIVFAFLTLGAGVLIANSTINRNPENNNTGALLSPAETPYPTRPAYVPSKADGTIIYGLWTQSTTEIKAVNSDGTNNFPLAYLPSRIKDIHVLSPTKLLFIAETDVLDHGKKLVIYDTQNKSSQTAVEAHPQWGIDDVIVSPDKSYIAWWEVKFLPTKRVFIGGQSRVYLMNLNTNEITLVTDEIAEITSPVHYPLFFDHKNRLFMDTFIPNQGRSYYLGIDYVTPDNSTVKVSVPQLVRGQFSSKPQLSATENKVAFIGFDPNAEFIIDQPVRENPKRLELDNPNQIVLLDLDTLSKKVIADSREGKIFSGLSYSLDSKSIAFIVRRFSPPPSPTLTLAADTQTGIYDLETGKTRFLTNNVGPNIQIIDYRNSNLITAQLDNESVGSLGDTYAGTVSKFSSLNIDSNKVIEITAYQPKTQFISYLPRSGGNDSINVLEAAAEPTESRSTSLKLGDIVIPQSQNLEPREGSQNDTENCNTNGTTNPDQKGQDDENLPEECRCRNLCPGYKDQYGDGWKDICRNDTQMKCFDSPLYLYTQTTSEIEVKPVVADRIYFSSPRLVNQKWVVDASPEGKKINYNYFSLNTPAPKYGLVTKFENLSQTLNLYAVNLGLKGKEITDFVSFWINELNSITSPYIFISHFDREAAAKIMSFEFDPKPDTFIQVIMYFKPLQYPISVSPPVFEEIPQRRGFTAVDWSGKIDK